MKTVKISLLLAAITAPAHGAMGCWPKPKGIDNISYMIVRTAKENLRLNTTKNIPVLPLNELFEALNTANYAVTGDTLTAIFKTLTKENYKEILKKLDVNTNDFIKHHPFENDLEEILLYHEVANQKELKDKTKKQQQDNFKQIIDELKKLNSTMHQVKKLLDKEQNQATPRVEVTMCDY